MLLSITLKHYIESHFMNLLQKIFLSSCLIISHEALIASHPSTAKIITNSMRKSAIILAGAAYCHQVVTGPQDFTSIPNFSVKDIKDYRDLWGKTLHNTYASLGMNKNIINFNSLNLSSLNFKKLQKTTDEKKEESQTTNNVSTERIGNFSPEDFEKFLLQQTTDSSSKESSNIEATESDNSSDPATPNY